ncbi:Zn-dependent exopeptidase [Tilletiaria anomala UBC 951]|uniref:Peptide hydrolase n=1 Tax=Tilletiaria anomala (strain ATCC 24038 / CBS 436.72 / UBC 951) TaxID=1037660 RepID=A0A066W5D3_TILAU|nr:Zn-dependent exopeptidase [Tilletiaria anomala UBC 951]KDN46279.1 Zn-dependent exopeptidase [Tilletiaria anomala UBC 951]
MTLPSDSTYAAGSSVLQQGCLTWYSYVCPVLEQELRIGVMQHILSYGASALLMALGAKVATAKPIQPYAQPGNADPVGVQLAPWRKVDSNAAAAQGADAACFESWGTYPTWDAARRELVSWVAYKPLSQAHGACALHTKTLDGGRPLSEDITSEKQGLLFFVSQTATEASLNAQDPCDWAHRLANSIPFFEKPGDFSYANTAAGSSSNQVVLQGRGGDGRLELTPKVVSLWKEYAILSLPNTPSGQIAAANIDKYLPFDTYVSTLKPQQSSRIFPAEQDDGPDYGQVKYNPLISLILQDEELNKERIRKTVEVVSGEDQRTEFAASSRFRGWDGRHSATIGARNAARWIKDEMQNSLLSVPDAKCHLWEYNTYYAPNVMCNIPASRGHANADDDDGDENARVIISAHYDSRGTFGNVTAPGADDDGSGTSALLSIGRVLGSKSVRFSRPVQLIFFSGEEQGLVGSDAYAQHLKDANVHVHLQLQIDMIAYRVEGEPMQMAFPDRYDTKTATKHVMDIAQVYVPEIVVGYTPACCSDHQSFWSRDYPSTWVFERNNAIADPMYHNSGDYSRRKGYDYAQLQATTRVVLATLLTRAGFYL